MEKEEKGGNEVQGRGDIEEFFFEFYALLTSVFLCAYGYLDDEEDVAMLL